MPSTYNNTSFLTLWHNMSIYI